MYKLPDDIARLYRHWDKHTAYMPDSSDLEVPGELEYFINERMDIWKKKINGSPRPYSKDRILSNHRFCNIYRELDAQTIAIHKKLNPLRDDFDLWLLNLAFERFICRPETIERVGLLSFDVNENLKVCKRLLNLPRPKYGSAYVFPISVIQKSQHNTREKFFTQYLPTIMPAIAKLINNFNETTVNSALDKILPEFGFNFRFHWTEILIDVAYQFPDKIDLFRDFHVGPGALPTAQLLKPNLDPKDTVDKFVNVKISSEPYLYVNNKPVQLSAENWEGIFCEYRKYTNLKSNRGRVRKY